MNRNLLEYLPFPDKELARSYLKSPYCQGVVLCKDLTVALMCVLRLLPQNLVLLGINRLLKHLLRSVEFLFSTS